MRKYVSQNAEPWAKVGHFLEQVDSTSAELHRRLKIAVESQQVLPEGYNISAAYQSAGRGRLGRAWEGEPGANLAVSYLLDASFLPVDRLFALSQNLALAVRQSIAAWLPDKTVQLKWPNDILVGNRKVAGLLLETGLLADRVSWAVLGVGINVTQTDFDGLPSATSIHLEGGSRVRIAQVLKLLTKVLQERHAQLRQLATRSDLYGIRQDYHTHLYGLGQRRKFEVPATGQEFFGVLLGTTSTGQLRVDVEGDENHYQLDGVRLLL